MDAPATLARRVHIRRVRVRQAGQIHLGVRIGVAGERSPAVAVALGDDDVEAVVAGVEPIVVDRAGRGHDVRGVGVVDRDRRVVARPGDAVAAGIGQGDRRVERGPQIDVLVDRSPGCPSPASAGTTRSAGAPGTARDRCRPTAPCGRVAGRSC